MVLDDIHQEPRERVRSVQAVDDLVERLDKALERTGQSERTYVIFASDNGMLNYEHRWPSKGLPYENSIGVPMAVKGPDVPANERREQLVANIDLAPTVLEWAGADSNEAIDGRSFAPVLRSAGAPYRERLLIENYAREDYAAMRTKDALYVEYVGGFKELYDLEDDPYQLENTLAGSSDSEGTEGLARTLAALRSCSGESCRRAED